MTTTICEKVGRLLAHHHAVAGRPSTALGPPLGQVDLDAAEAEMARLLPDEVRDLYRCRNGALFVAPHIGFDSLAGALEVWRVSGGELELPSLSNAPGWVEPGALYRVLDIDRVDFCVVTTVGARRRTSPVLLLDLDADQLTVVAYTLEALLDWFLDGFERGEAELTEHGVFWKSEEILAFPPDMKPLGSPTGDDPIPWIYPRS